MNELWLIKSNRAANTYMDEVSQESQFTSQHKGFTKVPYKIHRCYGLSPYEKLILIDLITYMSDKNLCYPTIEAIARNVNSSSKTVERHITELASKKMILVSQGSWVLAVDLQLGDELQQSNVNTLTIDNIKIVKHDEKVKVYNFTVADFHTYFVSDLGIWVHNINCDFTLSSNNIQHIGKHIASDFTNQVSHLSDKALAAKLNKNSFFNPKWTKEDIITGVQNGANEAISKGFTDGYYKYSHKGETIQIFFKDGKFDTAFGQHKLTPADFGR